jgi:hypothetical protein
MEGINARAMAGLSHAQAESLRDMLRVVYDNLAVLDRGE